MKKNNTFIKKVKGNTKSLNKWKIEKKNFEKA